MKQCVLIILFIFSFFSLSSADELSMQAQYAQYNGTAIVLSGDVNVDHELGKITANHVELFPEVNEYSQRFSHIHLSDDVNIHLKDGGHLTCGKADIDFEKLKGQFYGDFRQEFVTYTENCRDKTGLPSPLILKSHSMVISLLEDPQQKNVTHSIGEIRGENSVTINYNDDYVAAADRAIFHRQNDEENKTAMPGVITLHMNDDERHCQLWNRQGDLIEASRMCIDTIHKNLLFSSPKGSMTVSRSEASENKINFSCDTMSWDDKQQLLVLRDHVVIDQQGMGILTTDGTVNLYQYICDGETRLKSIETNGYTVLTYVDAIDNVMHTLTSFGKAIVDHRILQTVLESPKGPDGAVLADKQVRFQDNMGDITADTLTICYTMLGKTPVPSKFLLEGNVSIKNQQTPDHAKSKIFIQYALADRVEYTPQAKEVKLYANEKNRVLFFDKINNLQVSAPVLYIRRDQVTKKDSVQGEGDVRFTFLERELEKIQQFLRQETHEKRS